MVREFTELQGTMGGIYAREEGLPEEVWKAIYFHYLPIGVEADAPPVRAQLGKAAVTWAAVSLADKLDTIVGLFAAGEKPTGSRDPYGLRRAAQGVGEDSGRRERRRSRSRLLVEQRTKLLQSIRPRIRSAGRRRSVEFLKERPRRTCSSAGASGRTKYAPFCRTGRGPHLALKRIDARSRSRSSADFEALAVLLKRVNNITKDKAKTVRDEAT